MTSGLINVPVDTFRIQISLPHDINESSTVVVEIKRRLVFKSIFFVGWIGVHNVIKALKWLCKTPLYKLENVKVNES